MRRLIMLALTVSLAAACGAKKDTAAPLGSASLTLNHAKIPLGSPVELTYRFELAPGAQLDKEYWVLAHFLDANDELMWTDDHKPPVPSTQWKPGTPIEYKRTMFVPLYPYIGEATVSIGLYVPGSNLRVPLSGQLVGQRSYRAAKIQLQPQTDNVFLAFLDGWHSPEVAPQNQFIEWQWTRKNATIRFRNPKRNATFYLHYDGMPKFFPTAQTATVSIGDTVVDTFQVTTTDEQIRRIALKAAQFGNDDMVVARISLDQSFVPAMASPGSRDSRELGIRVFHAFIEPQ
ncbi:MAG: hypothetical protein WCP29_11460 [Acidobacteriota bacterium]